MIIFKQLEEIKQVNIFWNLKTISYMSSLTDE